MHISFLESKGLNPTEIQETLNRMANDDMINSNYDPICIPFSKLCNVQNNFLSSA